MTFRTESATNDNENRSGKGNYWAGFAAGAAIGTGAAIASVVIANLTGNRNSRIVRLEDSVQIGKPVAEVFRAWSDLEALADRLEYVDSVRVEGNISHWTATVDGKQFKWTAETAQVIPNEVIGWKSVSGPKHTGRITFSPIGNDTLVHVTMNYAPAVGIFSRLLSPFNDHLRGHINQSLRDFKSAMEGGSSAETQTHPERVNWHDSIERMKKTVSGVDYTRSQYKYPTGT